jgi:hypothetical protein
MTGLLGFGVARVSAVWSGRIEQYAAEGVDRIPHVWGSRVQISPAIGPPVSVILAGKVGVDQADGGGTFAHRCCHPFD